MQTCITSPPYFGLRDYGTAKWEGGDARCDHAVALGGNGAASAKQVSSNGTQSYKFRSICRKCGARRIDNQIGIEKSPDAYVAKLVEVFRELRRVLKGDGTVWLNLGDSYNNNPSTSKIPRGSTRQWDWTFPDSWRTSCSGSKGTTKQGAAAYTSWNKKERSDRYSLARSIRVTGRWLVVAIRHHLA